MAPPLLRGCCMNRLLIVLVMVIVAFGASRLAAQVPDKAGEAAFERLRTLVGEWEGTFAWSGARKDSGAMNASYYVTGNNSAVVENLMMGGVPSMTTVYHLDGDDLRMTHYCAARNQPRLKATQIDNAQGFVNFSFVDATNLSSPDAPHVHGLEFRFLDANHITLTFLFQSGSKEGRELIALSRVKSPQAKQRPSATPSPP